MHSQSTMAKKSNAKIRRMQARAAARGEVYVPIKQEQEEDCNVKPQGHAEIKKEDGIKREAVVKSEDNVKRETAGRREDKVKREANVKKEDGQDATKLKAARQLESDLKKIETDNELKAKDRRAAKRKAEAIATETTGMPANDLLEWYNQRKSTTTRTNKHDNKLRDNKKPLKSTPYVVFVGQLDYSTTKQDLFDHFGKELGNHITHNNLRIRLLNDKKTGKSRGMAFVEVDTPDLLYACLKLHHTTLHKRRINVERTTGGSKTSAARQERLEKLRQDQSQYMEYVTQTIIQEFINRGEIQEGELDEGVVKLCARHSATVVQAALERYVDSNGKDMDNPSAYLTFLLSKLSVEGIYDRDADGKLEHKGGPVRKKIKTER
jgi:RNA recognition motif. (a.k.a. RRM, RBD, or RNP domain)